MCADGERGSPERQRDARPNGSATLARMAAQRLAERQRDYFSRGLGSGLNN
jgi:hypothetical protein